MSQDEWADLVRGAFGAMNSGPFGSGPAGGTTVREEIYTRSDGARIVRTTTTTQSPNGSISQSITERIVGVGGPYDADAGQRRWDQHQQQKRTPPLQRGGKRKPQRIAATPTPRTARVVPGRRAAPAGARRRAGLAPLTLSTEDDIDEA